MEVIVLSFYIQTSCLINFTLCWDHQIRQPPLKYSHSGTVCGIISGAINKKKSSLVFFSLFCRWVRSVGGKTLLGVPRKEMP